MKELWNQIRPLKKKPQPAKQIWQQKVEIEKIGAPGGI
jgi:hypothetical protein